MSQSPEASERSAGKRGKKACTECRQQKARCDAYLDPNRPCSRCRKMNVRCVISDPFKRENKRQRLSELEQEAEILRRRFGSMNPTPAIEPIPVSKRPATEPLSQSARPEPLSVRNLVEPIENVQAEPIPALPFHMTPAITNLFPHDATPQPADAEPTAPRAIDGVELNTRVIDQMFAIYFKDFHHFLPIINPSSTPNAIYARSPFLFWSIVGVGCRNFKGDPTLLSSLGPKILNLAHLSLQDRNGALPNIKGILLLLTWPIPQNTVGMNSIFPLSGSLIHLAMQNGLHVPASSEDFAKVKHNLTEDDINRRAGLWIYCIVTYQRACTMKGQAPLALLDTAHEADQVSSLVQRASPTLRLQLKLHTVVARAHLAMLENGLRLLSPRQEKSLDMLIRIFDTQIKDLSLDATTDLDQFWVYVSRLDILVFHFYKSAQAVQNLAKMSLYNIAQDVLDFVEKMQQAGTILPSVPFYIEYAVTLASFVVLRILKGHFETFMDPEDGKAVFYKGVNLMKSMAVEPNDLCARIALVLTQLWTSEKAFRNPDGTRQTALIVRSRLAMSPVYDAFRWWKDEFGAHNPILGTSAARNENGRSEEAVVPPTVDQTTLLADDGPGLSSFLDDQLLADFGWTIGMDVPTTPFPGPSNWQFT